MNFSVTFWQFFYVFVYNKSSHLVFSSQLANIYKPYAIGVIG